MEYLIELICIVQMIRPTFYIVPSVQIAFSYSWNSHLFLHTIHMACDANKKIQFCQILF